MYLEQIRPAENLILLYNNKANHKEVLKLTLADLLLRQVLEITTEIKHGSRKSREIKYIQRGVLFDAYHPHHFEKPFISPFQKSPDIRIIMQKYSKIIYQNTGTEPEFNYQLIKHSGIRLFFSQNIFQRIFNRFRLNDLGENARNELLEEIANMERQLHYLIKEDREKAISVIRSLHGNIYLLKGINSSEINYLDELVKATIYSSYGTYNAEGCFSFTTTDFGCSSCSGDGCSGCSGCSGCGGCGGD